MLTAKRLREVLSYDPITGEFRWLISSNHIAVGSTAGTIESQGYCQIKVDQRIYKAHRLAWLYMHGVWPTNQIDHEDGVKANNIFTNLRQATNTENMLNLPKRATNKTGFKGVSVHKTSGKFVAQAQINGKRKHLGLYATAELASEAYQASAKANHGIFYKQP